MAKVLIVEDDDVIGQGMATHLTLAGFDPLLVAKGETGLARLRFERPDVCVLDLMLPGLDGWQVIESARSEAIRLEELVIDPADVQAYVDGTSAGLTPTEFRLLHALALEQGRVVTREELMQRIWGRRHRYRDRTVDVFVRKLRDKIDRQAPRHTFIHTRYGVGYKLEPLAKALAENGGGASL